jgi:hypothetical protein
MATKTNLYIDKILSEHPIAAWSLDEDFSVTGPFTYLDSLYSPSSIVIPTQTTSNGGGYMSFNTTGNHGLLPGDYVLISGLTPNGYNGRYSVYATPSATNFTVNGTTSGNVTVAGTVTKNYQAYELTAYNTNKYPGYVLRQNPLSSKVPMVYGSEKSQYGSFILPSFGFLSHSGRYGQYTLETWIKMKRTKGKDKVKLIGLFNTLPTTDDGNGLYLSDSSLILKIGNKSDMAYIKQTHKPLLIHITYSENAAALFVNGEQLINLILETSDIDLLTDTTNNYLTFQSATYDCPAIYPYRLSLAQAKVHYAYGQAVTVPETINKKYGGKTVSIDFASAKYAAGYNYPNNAEWKSGISDGLTIDKYSIASKKFTLPQFNFYDTSTETAKTLDDFVSVLSAASQAWKPKYDSFSTVNSNVEMKSLNLVDSKIKGFYADYSINGTASTSEKTIFKLINKIDKNFLEITIQKVSSNVEIKYYFYYNGALTTLTSAKQTFTSSPNMRIITGISFDKFAKTYDNRLSTFLNATQDLALFAFGNNNLNNDTTPDVTINWIKFLTQYKLDKWSQYFVDSTGRFFCPTNALTSGTAEANQNESVATYELKYIQSRITYGTAYTYDSSYYSENYFTIGTSGYWKNDVPLKYFAKYVKDASNNDVYTFNNIQFNVDYDAPLLNTTASGGIKYFDTSNSNVKTYVTFELIDSDYQPDSAFTIVPISIDRTVKPNPANYLTKKYEVVDGTIIYPPSGVDISTLRLVKHIDVSVSDIATSEVEIKSLELASQAYSLNSATKNSVFTKYGTQLIPYTYTVVSGNKVYDYSGIGNARNPYIIEKKTSPHLSLDRLSGIRLVGFDSPVSGVYRGIRVPLNEQQNAKSKLSSIQMFIYYDATMDVDNSNKESFQFSSKEIFNIVASDRTLTATLTNTGTYESSATLSISSSIATQPDNQNIQYYINGVMTETPTINTNEWTVLSVVFPKTLSFDSFAGEFNITGPLAIDNITFYGFSNTEYLQNQKDGEWLEVKTPVSGSDYTWQYWNDLHIWSDLTIVSSGTSFPISPSKVYGMYTGTNILYPGEYGNWKTELHDVQYKFYNDFVTSKYTYSAN